MADGTKKDINRDGNGCARVEAVSQGKYSIESQDFDKLRDLEITIFTGLKARPDETGSGNGRYCSQ